MSWNTLAVEDLGHCAWIKRQLFEFAEIHGRPTTYLDGTQLTASTSYARATTNLQYIELLRTYYS